MAITKVVFSTCSFLFSDKKVLNNPDITLVFSTLFSFYLLYLTVWCMISLRVIALKLANITEIESPLGLSQVDTN